MSRPSGGMALAAVILAAFLAGVFCTERAALWKAPPPLMIPCPDGSCPSDPDRSFVCVLFLPPQVLYFHSAD